MPTNPFFVNLVVGLIMFYYGGDNQRKNCPHMTLDSDTKLIHDRDMAIAELASVTTKYNELKNGQMSNLVDSLATDNYKYQSNLNNCINTINNLEYQKKQNEKCKLDYNDLEYNKKLFLDEVTEFNNYKKIIDQEYEDREKNLQLAGECIKCPENVFEYFNLLPDSEKKIKKYELKNSTTELLQINSPTEVNPPKE